MGTDLFQPEPRKSFSGENVYNRLTAAFVSFLCLAVEKFSFHLKYSSAVRSRTLSNKEEKKHGVDPIR